MPRYFKLEEAEALLPSLREALQRASEIKQDTARAEAELRAWRSRLNGAGGMRIDHGEFFSLRTRLATEGTLLRELIEEIQSTGCVVKDLDAGLIDFPALLEGEEVLLCWKLGEPEIGYWHRVEDGFGGRRPIGGEFGLPRA